MRCEQCVSITSLAGILKHVHIMFPLYACMCSHLTLVVHTNVVEFSNDSGAHICMYMHDITLISGHQLSKFVCTYVRTVCANVGVMFEHSYL